MPLPLVLTGKHSYNFHLKNNSESNSIGEAGCRLRHEIKTFPQLMRPFVRWDDDVDISVVAVDFFQNTLYQGIFFDTFEAVKQLRVYII